MTPQEREMVEQLFARLKQAPAQPKDPEADRLIRHGIMEQPDAPYKLVQTVLIQDMALREAQNRMAELERQLDETGAAQRAPSQAGSFLGGSASPGSVPSVNPWRRSLQPASASQTAPGFGSGQSAVASESSSGSASPGAAGPNMLAGASSGFLRAAAATALGVAGGQLLFQGVQSMFGHQAGGLLAGQSVPPGLSETVINNYYGDQGDPSSDTRTADADVGPDDGTIQSDDDPASADVAADDDTGDDPGADDSDYA